jgi:hypothetical protein
MKTLGLAAVALALAAPAAATADRTATAVYRDSTREDRAAPDIGRVAVSEARHGRLVFRIGIANRKRLTHDMGIAIVLDTDRSVRTGDPNMKLGLGADYLVTILDQKARLQRWSRTGGWRLQAAPAYAYDRGTASVVLDSRALGRSAAFDFDVSVAAGMVPERGGSIDLTNARYDNAPDAGWWNYVGVASSS